MINKPSRHKNREGTYPENLVIFFTVVFYLQIDTSN